MSAVRMCDSCGNIFSEREPDWSTYTGTRVVRDQNTGQQRQITDQMDTCKDCTIGAAKKPRLAIDSATGVDRVARTLTEADIAERLQ